MEVRYSNHLRKRLTMRGIPHELPRIVFEQATQRLNDLLAEVEIAVMRIRLFGKPRDVVVAYRRKQDHIFLITIHPLKPGQLENRIRTGRWKLIATS